MSSSALTPLVEMPQQENMVMVRGQPVLEDPDPEVTDRTGPCLSKVIGCLCCPNPAMWAGCCTKVDQNEQKAVLFWGRYSGTLREPGCFLLNPCGLELRTTSTKFQNMELKDIKVVDAKGNPVIISGVVTYASISAKKACVDVEKPIEFTRLQATTAMKQVASRYPYSAPPGQPSLQTEGSAISAELVQILQAKTGIAGTRVLNFELVDLSYAPEIAQVMLVKQQADALVEARRLLVGAAVDMTQQAVAQLEANGAALSDNARERITSNLLSVICSHSSVTPTVSMTH